MTHKGDDLPQSLDDIAALEPGQRLLALSKLSLASADTAVPGLQRFLDDEHPAVRVAASQALLQTVADEPTATRAFRLLIDTLTGADSDLSLAAGTAIVECATDLSHRMIDALQEQQHPLLARVLGELGGDVARQALLDVIAHSPVEAVRKEAREALDGLEEEQ